MVIEIIIDNQQLSKDQQSQIGRQVQQIKKVMRRLGKDQEAVIIRQHKEVQQKMLGLEKLIDWAIPGTKAIHLDQYVKVLGESTCNLMLMQKCENCPAKRYRQDKTRCVMTLGRYCISEFDRRKA